MEITGHQVPAPDRRYHTIHLRDADGNVHVFDLEPHALTTPETFCAVVCQQAPDLDPSAVRRAWRTRFGETPCSQRH